MLPSFLAVMSNHVVLLYYMCFFPDEDMTVCVSMSFHSSDLVVNFHVFTVATSGWWLESEHKP